MSEVDDATNAWVGADLARQDAAARLKEARQWHEDAIRVEQDLFNRMRVALGKEMKDS